MEKQDKKTHLNTFSGASISEAWLQELNNKYRLAYYYNALNSQQNY